MAHHRPESLHKRASENSLVSYSALPNSSSFGSPETNHSFTPSAYEFSIFSRDSLVPAETVNEHPNDGWRGHGAYQKVGGPSGDGQHAGDGRPKSGGAWLFFWASMAAGLLWIFPAIALLVLNFQGYIIGASAWCPGGYCPGQSGDPSVSASQMTAEYDRNNHNLLGGLQFAAKAAEVWFMAVAIGLVYQITSLLARSEQGLPIGYLTAYAEFTDLMYLLKSTLWTSAHAAPGQRGQKKKRRTMRYYAFGLFVAFTCIIANLIGPLVAVLMIPTLNWRDMPKSYELRFGSMLSSQAPSGGDAITGCTADNLTAGRYSCTSSYYGHSLDALFEYFLADYSQRNAIRSGNVSGFTPAASKEQALSIKFNFSDPSNNPDSTMYWAPNRLVVKQLSNDLQAFYNGTKNPRSEYIQYNNSLSLLLERQGPILGYQGVFTGTNVTVTKVAADKEIRCYQGCYFDQVNLEPYAKCYRVGTGWNATNAVATFTVGQDSPPLNSTLNKSNLTDTVLTRTYFADKAMWQQTILEPGNDMPPCLPNGTAPTNQDCDYDAMFNSPPPAAIPQNATFQTANNFIIENTLATDPSIAIMVEGHYSLGFATYTADVSGFSPSWGVVQIDSFPDPASVTPLVVHPSWLLAAWSVRNGSNVPYTRVSARQLQLTMANLHRSLANASHVAADVDDDVYLWQLIVWSAGLQAASLVPFATTDPQSDDLPYDWDDPVHPSLASWVRRQVWSFGLDTRTAKLAVIVLGVAIVLVLLRTALMLWTRTRLRDLPELMIAAMRHTPRGEFQAAEGSQMRMERMRFQIEDSPAEHIHFRKA